MVKQTHLDIQLLSRLAGEAGKALVLAAQGDAPGAGQSLARFRSTQEHLLENLQKEFLSPLYPEDAASLAASLESAASAALLWARWQTLCPLEGNIPLAGASGLAVRLETAAAGLCGNKNRRKSIFSVCKPSFFKQPKMPSSPFSPCPASADALPSCSSPWRPPDICADAFIPLRRLSRPWSASA